MAHKINYNPHLARGYPETIEQQIRTTYQGQAHFGNTGPFGATCAECGFLGYYRRRHNACGDLISTSRWGGCAKFHELTGQYGPVVPGYAAACKYFQRREK